jgi:hypothetical protein
MEDFYDINIYLDSIVNNYPNLGYKPCVSILSVNLNDNDDILMLLLYSAEHLQTCIKNKNCNCSVINYEKFIIGTDLSVHNYYDDNKPNYIDDLSNIAVDIIKEFYY